MGARVTVHCQCKFRAAHPVSTSEKEYLHSPVLRSCVLGPYVPLRNATKRERLRFGSTYRMCSNGICMGSEL